MPRTIISDTSCLIVLTNIGELDLLRRLYGQVITTRDIAIEYGEQLPSWIEVVDHYDKSKQHLLALKLDNGSQVQLPWRWKLRIVLSYWMIRKHAGLPVSSD